LIGRDGPDPGTSTGATEFHAVTNSGEVNIIKKIEFQGLVLMRGKPVELDRYRSLSDDNTGVYIFPLSRNRCLGVDKKIRATGKRYGRKDTDKSP
jgi:hypothetical protein